MCEKLIGDLLGGIIAGLIGFISAIGMFHYDLKYKKRKRSNELLDMLYLEISKNWFSLGIDLRENSIGMHKLSNNMWNIDKISEMNIEDPDLTGSIDILYKKISKYNSLCEIGETEKLYNLANVRALDLLKMGNNNVPNKILEETKIMKAVVFRELVRRKKRKSSEWKDDDIDFETAKSPYLK